jgi:hypothetical protein
LVEYEIDTSLLGRLLHEELFNSNNNKNYKINPSDADSVPQTSCFSFPFAPALTDIMHNLQLDLELEKSMEFLWNQGLLLTTSPS